MPRSGFVPPGGSSPRAAFVSADPAQPEARRDTIGSWAGQMPNTGWHQPARSRAKARWRRGPLITLGLVAAAAAVIAGLNMTAMAGERTSNLVTQVSMPAPVSPVEEPGTGAAQAPATLPPTSAVALPPLSTPSAERLRVTMAGRVDDGVGTLAISIRDGQAVAYVCDGDRLEAWLKGTAKNGLLNLTGRNNTRITGLFDATRAAGEITIGGKPHRFEVGVVRKPSGLYRLAARVGNAEIDGSWIVLPDGRQVGVLLRGGKPGPAPALDLAGRRVTVDGQVLTGATTIDVDTGEGF